MINFLKFTKDSILKVYAKDTLQRVDTFHLEKGYWTDTTNVLVYNYTSIRQSFEIRSGDTLILRDICYDCSISIFKRLRQ